MLLKIFRKKFLTKNDGTLPIRTNASQSLSASDS